MKSINCAVIQDLLPSYCDKVSSKETNLLVEEHLSECAKCREKLKILNKELNVETTYSQQDEIDFLKGYRRSKRRSTIFAITIVLIIVDVIFILLNSYIPDNFTGRDYVIDDINDVNLEYMYWVNPSSNSLALYLYSDKYKELKGYVGQIINPTTGGHEILIQLMAKRELRPFVGEHMYVSGIEEYVDTTDIDRICIESSGYKKEIWNKDTKVPSEEEWINWYIESYLPEEVKNKYGIDYDAMHRSYPGTGMWRHLYKPKN